MKLQGTAAGGVFQQPGQSLEKRGQGVQMFASFITVRLIKFLFHSLFILLRGKCKGH